MWVSVREGMRLSRLTVNRTSLLFLVILILGEGLNMLWRVPDETSWLTIVGILGHGFVTTALLAASFVYYRDGERWVEHILIQARLAAIPEDLRKA
jgi:NhaP-type Na+/H+ or K+/H+ antiporter